MRLTDKGFPYYKPDDPFDLEEAADLAAQPPSEADLRASARHGRRNRPTPTDTDRH